MDEKTMGAQLSDLLMALADLIDVTPDAQERARLLDLQRLAASRLQPLIDATLNPRLQEYKDATAKLEVANEALKTAKKHIDQVAAVIDRVAQAISAVAKLAAAV